MSRLMQGELLLLLCIFLLGMFLRFYRLSSFPVGFQIDEAIIGYTGYSILHTGSDTNNHFLPLYTEVFGDNIPTGYHYLTIPGLLLFGLSEFSTRLPGAFFGSLTVLAIYFLALFFTKDKKVSVVSSFLLAISPWHIALSRGSSEAIVSLFFIVSGFAVLFWAIEKKRRRGLIVGIFLLIFSFFCYHTARVFVSLFLFACFFPLYRSVSAQRETFRKVFFSIVFLLLVISFSLVVVFPGGKDRFSQVSIFNFPETRLVLNEQMREDGVNHIPVVVTRAFHNNLINYSLTFLGQYFSHFTFDYLFLKGGLPMMFQIPNMGLMYLIEFPFLLYGIFVLAKGESQRYRFVLFWLLLSPIVVGFTVDDVPNVRRSITMLPALEIAVAVGVVYFYKKIGSKKNIIIGILGFLFFANMLYFFHQYFVHAKAHKTWYRNNGVGVMMSSVENEYKVVDKIIITKATGGIYPLVLFYAKFDPALYQQNGSTKDADYTGFGKFFFVPQPCPSRDRDDRFPQKGTFLYVDRGDCPRNNKDSRVILREDGTVGYILDKQTHE